MPFYGIIGPKGLPEEVVTKVHAAASLALDKPEVRRRIEGTGSLVVGNNSAEFSAQLQTELAVYKAVVAKQGLKLD